MISEEVRTEFSLAVERELSFLGEMGYRFSGVAESSTEALGPFLSSGYMNEVVNRIVGVIYLPRDNVPPLVSVAITNVSLIVPEPIGENDNISAQSIGVCVTDLSVAGNFTTGINQHLLDTARVLKDRFEMVLAGRDWQSDQFNLGEMK